MQVISTFVAGLFLSGVVLAVGFDKGQDEALKPRTYAIGNDLNFRRRAVSRATVHELAIPIIEARNLVETTLARRHPKAPATNAGSGGEEPIIKARDPKAPATNAGSGGEEPII